MKARMLRWRRNQALFHLDKVEKGALRSLVGASTVAQVHLANRSNDVLPTCTHCHQGVEEDVPHILWQCPAWQAIRAANPAESEGARSELPMAGITQSTGLLPLIAEAVPAPPIPCDSTLDPSLLGEQPYAGTTEAGLDKVLHTKPLVFSNGRLVVWTDGSCWYTGLPHMYLSLIHI